MIRKPFYFKKSTTGEAIEVFNLQLFAKWLGVNSRSVRQVVDPNKSFAISVKNYVEITREEYYNIPIEKRYIANWQVVPCWLLGDVDIIDKD